ncbi:MAG: hypothetical protein IPI66_12340 [Chitinophagaceae bacterium]|nr:hypothetical protein [Chitinophagaceae bacterium]MBL0056352.1 hypothetical protein [Chitinophagaceae bacterium]
MNHFTVRFELNNAIDEDYYNLDERLTRFDFSETIKSEDGQSYILPRGEYRISGEFTRQKVLDLAILAAGDFKHDCKILVTESNGTAWTGLTRV